MSPSPVQVRLWRSDTAQACHATPVERPAGGQPHGDVTLTPRLISAGEITEPFNLVILAVKAYVLEQALGDLDHILSEMLHRARDLNLATPLLAAAAAHLRTYQDRLLPA